MRAPKISPGKLRYGPIPARALCDPRLGAADLRVLGIIAAFDRLGKNGSGCWTSQNRLAAIIGIDKTRLSHSLSKLRNYGYVASEMNPDKRWFRVHRVIYTDADFDCLGAGKSVAAGSNRFPKSVAPQDNCLGKSVADLDPISCAQAQHQLRPSVEKDCDSNDVQVVTIVPTINRTIEETGNVVLRGLDRAEARLRSMPATEAETYLNDCESLPTEDLVFERKVIEQLANDPCLPDELNERAGKLLCQISQ